MPAGLHAEYSAASPPTDSEDQQGQDSAPPPRVHSRSPHPYRRRKPDIFSAAGEFPPLTSGSSTAAYNRHSPERSSGGKQTPRRAYVVSPSESGTEADDERYLVVKALPAPPFRPRKGLRNSKGVTNGDITPLLSPDGLDGIFSRSSDGEEHASLVKVSTEAEDARVTQAKAARRRRAEIVRRVCEIGFLALLESIVLLKQRVWWSLSRAERGKFHHFCIVRILTGCSCGGITCLGSRNYYPPVSNSPFGLLLATNKAEEISMALYTRFGRVRSSSLRVSDLSACHGCTLTLPILVEISDDQYHSRNLRNPAPPYVKRI
jgi:hypothetical protein